MRKSLITIFFTSMIMLALSALSYAQIGHIVGGTVLNPDSTAPADKEIMFRAYLTKSVADTSAPDSCSEGGGWGVDVMYQIPNSTWEAGDTLVVIFTNVGTSQFAGAVNKLVYVTTDVSPEFVNDFALPVEMTTFDAFVYQGSFADEVVLNWKTVGESNNYGFEVQRSEDGKNFERIGFVSGAGSTNTARSYEFRDPDVQVGTYFYRLKQIDTNGSFTYSEAKEVSVKPPDQYQLSQNYPNPFNPKTNIIFRLKEDGRVSIRLYDVLGREVMTVVDRRMKAGTHKLTIDGSQLPSGLYLYSMKAGNFHQVKKMALVK